MGFTSQEDNGSGELPDITAVITDIGIDYREYENGNEENRVIVIWEPETENFSTQTVILSTYNLLDVEVNAKQLRVGGQEKGFELEIVGNVIRNGKLGYKAAVWMNKLEELGVKIPSQSGDLYELIGTKAVLRQMTYNEAKGRERQEREKPFWMPIEIIPTAEKTSATDVVDKTKEDDLSQKPELSLYDAILEAAPGKTEKELVDWFTKSPYYGIDESVVPLFMELEGVKENVEIDVRDGVYIRLGINAGEEK